MFQHYDVAPLGTPLRDDFLLAVMDLLKWQTGHLSPLGRFGCNTTGPHISKISQNRVKIAFLVQLEKFQRTLLLLVQVEQPSE